MENLSLSTFRKLFPFPELQLRPHPLGWSPDDVRKKRRFMWAGFVFGWFVMVAIPGGLVILLSLVTGLLSRFPGWVWGLSLCFTVGFGLFQLLRIGDRLVNFNGLLASRGYYHEQLDFERIHKENSKSLFRALRSGRGFFLYLREFGLELEISSPFELPDPATRTQKLYQSVHRQSEALALERVVMDRSELPVFTLHNPMDAVAEPLAFPGIFAHRIFADVRDWQKLVSFLIGSAQEIFVFLDQDTPSLEWELQEILRLGRKDATTLVLATDEVSSAVAQFSKVQDYRDFVGTAS